MIYDVKTTGPEESDHASVGGAPTTHNVGIPVELADLLFGSETTALSWATMYNTLNQMSIEVERTPSGSCPDMGRHASAHSPVPKKDTHPTHTPSEQGDDGQTSHYSDSSSD